MNLQFAFPESLRQDSELLMCPFFLKDPKNFRLPEAVLLQSVCQQVPAFSSRNQLRGQGAVDEKHDPPWISKQDWDEELLVGLMLKDKSKKLGTHTYIYIFIYI